MQAEDVMSQQLNETWKLAQSINPEYLFTKREGANSQRASELASQLKVISGQVDALRKSMRGKEHELSQLYGRGNTYQHIQNGTTVTTEYKTRTRREETCAHPAAGIDAMNAAAVRKWQRPSVQNSTLLAGPSYLEHVPGSQYCINAGLHHHHHVRRESSPAPSPPPPPPPRPLPPWDRSWFVTMESRLQEIADVISTLSSRLLSHGNCNCYADAIRRFTETHSSLITRIDTLRRELEAGRHNKDLLELVEKYRQQMESLERERGNMRREIERLLDEVARLNKLVGQQNHDECRRNERRLESEIMLLKDQLREKDNIIDRLRGENSDLRRESDSLRAANDELLRENERLRRQMPTRDKRYRVLIKDHIPTAYIAAHKPTEEGKSLWASGVVARQHLTPHGAKPVVDDMPVAWEVLDEEGNRVPDSIVHVDVKKLKGAGFLHRESFGSPLQSYASPLQRHHHSLASLPSPDSSSTATLSTSTS